MNRPFTSFYSLLQCLGMPQVTIIGLSSFPVMVAIEAFLKKVKILAETISGKGGY